MSKDTTNHLRLGQAYDGCPKDRTSIEDATFIVRIARSVDPSQVTLSHSTTEHSISEDARFIYAVLVDNAIDQALSGVAAMLQLTPENAQKLQNAFWHNIYRLAYPEDIGDDSLEP